MIINLGDNCVCLYECLYESVSIFFFCDGMNVFNYLLKYQLRSPILYRIFYKAYLENIFFENLSIGLNAMYVN